MILFCDFFPNSNSRSFCSTPYTLKMKLVTSDREEKTESEFHPLFLFIGCTYFWVSSICKYCEEFINIVKTSVEVENDTGPILMKFTSRANYCSQGSLGHGLSIHSKPGQDFSLCLSEAPR